MLNATIFQFEYQGTEIEKLGGVGSLERMVVTMELSPMKFRNGKKKLHDCQMQTYCNSKWGFSKTGGICTSDSHMQEGISQSGFFALRRRVCRHAS